MKKHALIVDDAPTAVEILRRGLDQLDIVSQGVGTGEAALEFLDQAQVLPDYVFMDVIMPGIDGYEATQTLLSQDKTSHLVIIIYTTLKSDEDRKKAQDVGAMGFLSKPFTLTKLKECLAQL